LFVPKLDELLIHGREGGMDICRRMCFAVAGIGERAIANSAMRRLIFLHQLARDPENWARG
jgi:hypothetical protein